jgi:hypothetical protein
MSLMLATTNLVSCLVSMRVHGMRAARRVNRETLVFSINGHQRTLRLFERHDTRIGRIKIAQGLDAVECAFATVYGAARLTNLEVWAYQVDPDQVAVGDPIDLSKRLDGVKEIKS